LTSLADYHYTVDNHNRCQRRKNHTGQKMLGPGYNWGGDVPRKIRELVRDLLDAGFGLVPSAGKGSHRKYTHVDFRGAVTLSGQDGDDAKKYQEKQVKRAIEEVER
jgi:predicted RNA binding protein YcfA (HicA-like mRNA interferase family)